MEHADLSAASLSINVDVSHQHQQRQRVKLYLAGQAEELLPFYEYEGVTLVNQNVRLSCESDRPDIVEARSDTAKRDLYDKFGKAGVEFDGADTTKLFSGLGFFYVMWLAIAYLLTRRKAFGRAQTWAFTGLMAMGIFEYQACVGGQDFLQDQLTQVRRQPSRARVAGVAGAGGEA